MVKSIDHKSVNNNAEVLERDEYVVRTSKWLVLDNGVEEANAEKRADVASDTQSSDEPMTEALEQAGIVRKVSASINLEKSVAVHDALSIDAALNDALAVKQSVTGSKVSFSDDAFDFGSDPAPLPIDAMAVPVALGSPQDAAGLIGAEQARPTADEPKIDEAAPILEPAILSAQEPAPTGQSDGGIGTNQVVAVLVKSAYDNVTSTTDIDANEVAYNAPAAGGYIGQLLEGTGGAVLGYEIDPTDPNKDHYYIEARADGTYHLWAKNDGYFSYEVRRQPSLKIKVWDATSSATTTLQFDIHNIRENPYDLAIYGAAVSEKAQQGFSFAALGATIPEGQPGWVRWYLEPGGTHDGAFGVTSNGAVYVADASKLRGHGGETLSLVVKITVPDADNSENLLTTTQTFEIGIIDENEAPHSIRVANQTTLWLAENTTDIGLVSATDADLDPLTFSLDPSNDPTILSIFQIVSGEGGPHLVARPGKLDYEAAGVDGNGNRYFTVKLRVTDDEASATQDITVYVNPVDEAPNKPSPVHGNILENPVDSGAVIARVLDSTDPEGAVVTYAFATSDGSSSAGGRFVINAVGQIMLNPDQSRPPINFEATRGPNGEDPYLIDDLTGTYYKLWVVAKDETGHASAPTEVRVYVTDANEAPTGATYATNTMNEDADPGALVATVTQVHDPDTSQINRDFRYKLVDDQGNEITGASHFIVNETSGEISVGTLGLPGVDEVMDVRVRVKITDKGGAGQWVIQDVFVRVEPGSNSAPSAPQPRDGLVAELTENVETAVQVATMRADDDGLGGPVRYSIVNLDDLGGFFSIGSVSGVITFNGAGNYEAANILGLKTENPGTAQERKYFEVKVQARESVAGQTSPVSIVKVYLNDVNEAMSGATYATPNVMNENAQAGAVIVAAPAVVDPDTRAAFRDYRFKLVNQDDTDYAGTNFAINPLTGEVTVGSGRLPDVSSPTQIPLRIMITEVGGSGSPIFKDLSVTVNPAGNTAPSKPMPVDGVVAEMTENGGSTFVATVQSTDDGQGGALIYEFASGGNPNGLFNIDPDSGEITFVGGVSYEATNLALQVENRGTPQERKYFNLQVQTRESESGATSVKSIIKVYLNDVNEAPSSATYGTPSVLDETAQAGTLIVGAPSVTDPDTRSTFRDFRFKLVNIDNSDYTGSAFAINETTGEITVGPGGLPDVNSATDVPLRIKITDAGSQGNSIFRTVTVRINPVEGSDTIIRGADNPIVIPAVDSGIATPFTGISFATLEAIHVTIKLSGADQGVLVDTSGLGLGSWDEETDTFYVNGMPNVVQQVVRSLQFHPRDRYDDIEGTIEPTTFTITVYDQTGEFELDSNGNITVRTAADDWAPQTINLAGNQVAEDIGAGVPFGTFSATDPNGDAIDEYILEDNAGGLFSLVEDGTGWHVVANGPLNFERAPFGTGNTRWYEIKVKAKDTRGLVSDAKTIKISVTDVNEGPTGVDFDNPRAVEVGDGIGAYVVKARAIDQDLGETFLQNKYRFVNGLEGGLVSADGRFRINADTGEIKTNVLITQDDIGQIPLVVEAYDGSMVSPPVEYQVEIRPQNEAPAITVREGGQLSWPILDIETATPFQDISFSDSWDPTLYVSISFDGDTGEFVNVEDLLRQFPEVSIEYERSGPGSFITISGSHADITSVVQALIFDPTDRANAPVGQDLVTNFTIMVSDGSLHTTLPTPVTVTAYAANRAPTDVRLEAANEDPQRLGHVTINEGLGDGEIIGVLQGIDPNADEGFTYAFAPGGNPHDYFRIEGNKIVLNEVVLDYESTDPLLLEDSEHPGLMYYEVTVVAKDRGGLPTPPKIFRVYVNDVAGDTPNQAPTSISLSSTAIDENQTGPVIVGFLGAEDPDDREFWFHLSDDKFEVVQTQDGWVLQLKEGEVLDHETMPTKELFIGVTDRRGGYFEHRFVIEIRDTEEPNQDPTAIALDNYSIMENSPAHEIVGYLSATDPDNDPASGFGFFLADPGDGKFEVFRTEDNRWAVRLKAGETLNYEEATQHVIWVGVTDGRGGTFEQAVTIRVGNDTSEPEFNHAPTDVTLTNDRLYENRPSNTEVGVLIGVDQDGGDILSYAIVGGASQHFGLSQRVIDGRLVKTLVALNPLDFEGQIGPGDNDLKSDDGGLTKYYNVSVKVTDLAGASITKSFKIYVQDVQDETNRDPSSIVLDKTTVQENALDGATVGELSASDPDDANLSYSFVTDYEGGGDANGRFVLERLADGRTLLKVADGVEIDFEQMREFKIKVRADDGRGGNVEQVITLGVRNVLHETVGGMDGHDTSGADRIVGGVGNDTFKSGDGNDTLIGGAGNDRLWGEAGRDVFVFSHAGTTNSDAIVDFNVNQDKIQLMRSGVFTALAEGPLSEAAFRLGTRAEDTTDRIIYDQASGRLLYDSDGIGGKAAVEVAVLSNKAALNYGHFLII